MKYFGALKSRSRRPLAVIAAGAAALLLGLYFVFGNGAGMKEDAIAAYAEGEYATAAAGFERLIGPGDNDPEVLYYAGLTEIERKNFEKGIGQYLAALSASNTWKSRAFYHTLDGYLKAGRVEEARRVVETIPAALRKSPLAQEAQALYYTAQVELAERQIHEAIAEKLGDRRARATFEGLTRRVLRATSSVYTRSLDKVLERLQATGQFDDTVAVQILYDRGHEQLIDAVSALEKAIELAKTETAEPAPVRAFYELSEIFRIRGQIVESTALLRSVIDMPESAMRGDRYFENWRTTLVYSAQRNLAETMIANKQFNEAIQVLEGTRASDDDERRPYDIERMLAECYAGLGRGGKMLEITDYWLDKDPNVYAMNFLKGRHFYDEGRFEEALIYLERSVARGRTTREYSEYLARCYLHLKRYANASTVLEQLIEQDRRSVEYVLLRGEAMAGQGWREDTIAFYINALRTQFPDATSEGHRRIRARLNQFTTERGLEPKDLFTAEQMYSQDPENFHVARLYIDILVEARNLKIASNIANAVLNAIRPSDPNYHDVLMSCGNLALKRGAWQDAANLFDRAAKARPINPHAYLGQAEAYRQSGDVPLAWEALRKAEIVGAGLAEAQRLRFELHILDNETDRAATIGEELVRQDARNPELVQKVARAHLASGNQAAAARLLDRLKNVPFREVPAALDYGRLLLRSDRVVDGERLLIRVASENQGDVKVALGAAQILVNHQRWDAVIRVLSPYSSGSPETAAPALKVLARAHEAKGDYDAMLSTYSLLRLAGERNWVYDRVSEFCRARGAYDEALSIVETAVAENAATAELLESSVLLSLDLRDKSHAERWVRQFKRHANVSEARGAILEARVLSTRGEMPAAMDVLSNALKNAAAADARALRMAQIEVLGRAGFVDRMRSVLEESVRTLDGTRGLLNHATSFLIMEDHADAMMWQEEAIKREGASAIAIFNRAMLHVDAGNLAAARADLDQSLAASPGAAAAGAALVLIAVNGRATDVNAFARQHAVVLAGSNWTDAAALVLQLAGADQARIGAAVDAAFPVTETERREIKEMITAAYADAEALEVLRSEMPRILILRSSEFTLRKAVKAVRRLTLKLPTHARVIDFMAARILLRADWGFNAGIKIATQRMTNEVADETAFIIYAENYIAGRNQRALDDLIRFVLTLKNLRPSFYTDFARRLIDGGFPNDAARVLYGATAGSEETQRMQAEAHYRAGQIEQAGIITARLVAERPATAIDLEILAAWRARAPATLQDAFRAASDAVYRLGSQSPSAHLVLADVAYRLNNVPEAEKNIRKALALQPASSRVAIDALAVANRYPDLAGLSLRDWLDERRNVLDPAQRVQRSYVTVQ